MTAYGPSDTQCPPSVEDEWWIHLERHPAAVFWFDRDEQVAVPVLDVRAQQVADLQRGNGHHRWLWLRLWCVNDLRAASENEAEQECQPPLSHACECKDSHPANPLAPRSTFWRLLLGRFQAVGATAGGLDGSDSSSSRASVGVSSPVFRGAGC